MERNHEPGPGLLGGKSGWQHNKSWTASQPKPYLNPLPYRRSILRNSAGWDWGGLDLHNQMSSTMVNYHPRAYARAYDKFWGKASAKAEALLNLAELESSLVMAANRCRQIVDICTSLRKGRVGSAYGMASGLYGASVREAETWKKRAVKRKQSLSNAYLETAFGWQPIAEDLQNIANVLQADFGQGPVQGRAAESVPFHSKDGGKNISGAVVTRSELGGVVVVTNPNLFLANQLGMINVGVVAWDLVPGSFMVDWFLPVGKFLRSLSNGFGADVHRPYKTVSVIGHAYGEHQSVFGTANAFFMERSTGPLTTPGLLDRARLPEASLWHTATLAALAEQQLRGVFNK